jgi:cytochrome c biogenesis protein CcmG, thiol:disulfide interchange protein DsbE
MRLRGLSANGWLLVIFGVLLVAMAGEPAYRAMTGRKPASQIRLEKLLEEEAKMAAGPAVGDPAPGFTLKGADGRPVSLSDYKGRPVLVNFYCGCYLCRGVATQFEKMVVRPLKHRPVILSLCHFTSDRVAPFIQDTGAKHALYLIDEGKKVSQRWGSMKCPRTWLIDGQGKIAYRHEDMEGGMQPSPVPAQVRAVLDRPQLLRTAAR